ncbi:MAG: phage/plasmid primase, P4 family [Pseudomonadota bacterium]|jgi:putative DNA primase/helicase|nr:phage/plasmid primase, P4 family [Pseudomonadota bacterium]
MSGAITEISRARLQRDADVLLNNFSDTDVANSQRFAAQHAENVRYTAEAGWLIYDGRRWAIDQKDVSVTALAKQTAMSIYDEIKGAENRDQIFAWAKRSQSRRSIEAMIFLARSEAGILTKLTTFDRDPMLLNLENGTLDLATGQIRAHRREDFITKLVPIRYQKDAECELWDAFLWRVVGESVELYEYLRRLVGYLLTGSTTEQVLHFLHGLGANGKSVFCEVLQRLLGDYGVVLSPEVLMLKRHGGIPNDIARLRGARMAALNETTQGSRFDEAKLKDLTGGDTLTARFLHREFFDFSPTHKILIRGNHKPVINGTDEGIWRRLRLVPFTVQIPTEEQDHRLVEKLNSEVSGILNWAVQGCLEWQRDGLMPPPSVTEAVQRYREESDTLGRFISESCISDPPAQVKASALYQRYVTFCEAAGERWIPQKDFPAEMERRGFVYKRGTGGQRLYVGIELSHSESSWEAE